MGFNTFVSVLRMVADLLPVAYDLVKSLDGIAVRVPGGPEITGLTPASAYKVALAYQGGTVTIAAAGQSASAAMAWPAIASLGLGSIAGDAALNGCIRQAEYRPAALDAASLEGITA